MRSRPPTKLVQQLRALRGRRGRLVLIGDHMQMAPIVRGDYADADASLSILQLVCRAPAEALQVCAESPQNPACVHGLRALPSSGSLICGIGTGFIAHCTDRLKFQPDKASGAESSAGPPMCLQVREALEREPPGRPRKDLLERRKLLDNHRMCASLARLAQNLYGTPHSPSAAPVRCGRLKGCARAAGAAGMLGLARRGEMRLRYAQTPPDFHVTRAAGRGGLPAVQDGAKRRRLPRPVRLCTTHHALAGTRRGSLWPGRAAG